MKKYKIMSISTLTGRIKTDKGSVSRIGKVGYIELCEVNGESSCMIFIVNDGGYSGFVTTKVVNDKEEVDGYTIKRIITTQNSIYTFRELKEVEE